MMVLKSRAFIQLWSLTFQKYGQICNADDFTKKLVNVSDHLYYLAKF